MQDSQRRTLIFSVLDDMKGSGEKITAQKLATQAKMGKQTVLPYYREWQELEILGEDEEVDLSPELVRVLRREIGKEKFRQGEETRTLQDQLDEERDSYAAQAEIWRQQLSELQERVENQEESCQQLTKEKEQLQEQEREGRQKLTANQEKLEHLQQQLDKMEQRLQQESKRSEEALAEQERRLDESHTKIIDHWMKVLDEERREKGRLQKITERLESERAQLDKERGRLASSLEHEKKVHRETTDQLGESERRSSQLQENQMTLSKISNRLGDPNNLLDTVSSLCIQADQNKELRLQLEEKQVEIEQLIQTCSSDAALVKQLTEENKKLTEISIRLEAKLEGIQMAGSFKVTP